MRHTESKIQIACVRWFRYQYPHYALNLFSVPNGGWRGKFEAAIMKAEGITAGVSDLLLLVPNKTHHGLCIEMKTGEKGSRQSESQKEWQAAVESQGYQYTVCHCFDEFVTTITRYLDFK